MNLLPNIFLSKEEREIISIYKAIDKNWKESNDFLKGNIDYFKSLNLDYNLGINIYLLILIPKNVIIGLLTNGYSQRESMYIFSQYIYFFILRNPDPKVNRLSDIELIALAKNITKLLNSDVPISDKIFSHRIKTGSEVQSIIQIENTLQPNKKSKHSKEMSYELLSTILKCDRSNVKEAFQEQFRRIYKESNPISIDSDIEEYVDKMFEESSLLKIHHEDTPSSIILDVMTSEFRNFQKYRDPITDEEIFTTMQQRHGQFLNYILAKSNNNTQEADRIIHENPDIIDSFIELKAAQERFEETIKKVEVKKETKNGYDISSLDEDNLPF